MFVPVTLAVAATACIDAVQDPGIEAPPMCEVDTDCDYAEGEVCDEGVCWGNPPADSAFAAVLVPPDGREDLVPSEIPELVLHDDGLVEGLVFAERVTLSGRVALAGSPSVSVAAHVKVRRPSRIPGGPPYSRTVIASKGAADGELAFEIGLPRLDSGDEPYEVTVVPDDGTLAEPGEAGIPADLAPPMRFEFDGTEDAVAGTWLIGERPQLKRVSGRVIDAAERGLAGMKVFARGRWSEEDELARVSSTATTDDSGAFAIWIPLGMEVESYELVVRPPTGTVAPTLRMRGIAIPDPSDEALEVELAALQMPSYPAGARYEIPVRGHAPEGGVKPAEGAEVTATTFLTDPLAQGAEDGVVAFYTVSGVTDADGNVQLDLIPGGQTSRPYLVSVQPLATSHHASRYAAPINVGPPNPGSSGVSVLPELTLDFRLSVSGVLRTAGGEPLANVAVSAAASPIFKWNLDFALQAELDNYRFPTATTDADGRFVIWLDERLLGAAAAYDLELVPAAGAQAPRWSIQAIDVGARLDDGVVDLGSVFLPPAAFVRGDVLTPTGEPIPGAELKIYEISGDDDLCDSANVPNLNGDCFPPALLRHVTQSNLDGRATLVLPRP